MYRKILVALDNSQTDQAMVAHISELAKVHGSKLLLLHVADGWAARNYNRFQLADAEEMKEDRAYLERVAADFQKQSLAVETRLELGEPAREILKTARGGVRSHCHDHARSPLPEGSALREHDHASAASRARPGPARECEITRG